MNAIQKCESGDLDSKEACLAESMCLWLNDTILHEKLGSFDTALGEANANEHAQTGSLFTILPSSTELSCSVAAMSTTTVFALGFTEALRNFFCSGLGWNFWLHDGCMAKWLPHFFDGCDSSSTLHWDVSGVASGTIIPDQSFNMSAFLFIFGGQNHKNVLSYTA